MFFIHIMKVNGVYSMDKSNQNIFENIYASVSLDSLCSGEEGKYNRFGMKCEVYFHLRVNYCFKANQLWPSW